jgi:hypothetical protein
MHWSDETSKHQTLRAKKERALYRILMEKELKLSGNEVYGTNALPLLIKIMLCGKLYCQKILN